MTRVESGTPAQVALTKYHAPSTRSVSRISTRSADHHRRLHFSQPRRGPATPGVRAPRALAAGRLDTQIGNVILSRALTAGAPPVEQPTTPCPSGQGWRRPDRLAAVRCAAAPS